MQDLRVTSTALLLDMCRCQQHQGHSKITLLGRWQVRPQQGFELLPSALFLRTLSEMPSNQ